MTKKTRSAKSGRYVDEATAQANPDTTVTETDAGKKAREQAEMARDRAEFLLMSLAEEALAALGGVREPGETDPELIRRAIRSGRALQASWVEAVKEALTWNGRLPHESDLQLVARAMRPKVGPV